MVKAFDLYSGGDGESYVSLAELASTPEKFDGRILGLTDMEFLTTYVFEKNNIEQDDLNKTVHLTTGGFSFDAGLNTCDWFDYLVCSLENNHKTVLLFGAYGGNDVCCFHNDDDGLLLVNPDTQAIEEFQDYSNLINLIQGVDSYEDSAGIKYHGVEVHSRGYCVMFDESEEFRVNVLSRSKNTALIEYEFWEEQTWKEICNFKKLMKYYEDCILPQLTEVQINYYSEKLRAFEEKISGYKQRLNK